MVVCFREHAPVAILAANSKLYFWAAWTVMIDQGLPISLRLVNVPMAGRERDPSGCRASGLLPVHVVLVPPLLVTPSWPAVVVTSKLWTTAMYSRRIFSRFFVNTGGMHARMFNSDGYIAMKLNKIHFNSSKHNGYHVVTGPRHRRMQGEPLLALCFGISRVLTHSLWLRELHVAGIDLRAQAHVR